MLNIKRSQGTRGLPVLILLALLALPLQVGAQQSGQDRSKRSQRPPITVRVVTTPGVGVPVVVAAEPETSGDEFSDVPVTVVPVSDNVQIRFEGGAARKSSESEVENWLVGGPSQQESWLNGTAGESTEEPVAVPTRPDSARLLGVQHYMESTQAQRSDSAPASSGSAVTVAVPPRVASGAPVTAPPTRASAQPTAALGTYLLGPGDKIDVHVWRNPDLSRNVPVRPDGLISLPLVGELRAADKTVEQLKAEITGILEEYVQYPTVTVTVTEVRGMVIYVTGRVSRAGPLTLDRPINVVQAITMAGGVQEFAKRNDVVVIRTINGQRVRIPFRYGDAVKGKGNVAELMLRTGDVVYVP